MKLLFKIIYSLIIFLIQSQVNGTSGEQRISNFLLWQIAYSELYFTEILWPDLRENLFKQLQTTKKEKEDLVKLVNKLKKKMLKNSILISIVCIFINI